MINAQLKHGFRLTAKGKEALAINSKCITSRERQCLLLMRRNDDTSKQLCARMLNSNMVDHLVSEQFICNQSAACMHTQASTAACVNRIPTRLNLDDLHVNSEVESLKHVMLECLAISFAHTQREPSASAWHASDKRAVSFVSELEDDQVQNLKMMIATAYDKKNLKNIYHTWATTLQNADSDRVTVSAWLSQVKNRLYGYEPDSI